MFHNKRIFLTTGPSIHSPLIKKMIENYFEAIPLYVDNDDLTGLDYLIEQGDALVLAGGSDVFRGTLGFPVVHGESLSKFDILRDKRELFLINKFIEAGKPILAICRGFQLVCATMGFHLIPDLGGNICHSLGEIKINLENGEFAHYIEYLPKFQNKYSKIKMTGVNSYHHQGIYLGNDETFNKNLVRNGISVVATSDITTNEENNYKIAEIIESESKKIVGCQFHPECDYMHGNIASVTILERFKQMLEN